MKKETEENKDIYTNSDDQQAIYYEYTYNDYLDVLRVLTKEKNENANHSTLNKETDLEGQKDIINTKDGIEQNQKSTENKVEPTESLQEVYNNDRFNAVAISGSYVYFDSPFMFPRDFSDKLEAVSDLQAKPVDYIGEVAPAKIDPTLEIEDEKEVYTEEDWKRYF